jgi:hypothetical protein
MRTALLTAVLFGVAAGDEKDDLKKALEKTAAAKSYFSQWSDEIALMGNNRPVSGAGEFVAPDLVTFRTGITDIVKKGDKAMCKAKDGWVKAEEDKRNKALAASLKPAHEEARSILEKLEEPKKGKEAEVAKVKYRVVSGSLSGEALKEVAKAGRPNFGTLAAAIDWKSSKVAVDVLIDKKSGRLFRIAMAGDLKLVPLPIGGGRGGSESVGYKHSLEFLQYDEAKPSIDAEVKKALGMEDE